MKKIKWMAPLLLVAACQAGPNIQSQQTFKNNLVQADFPSSPKGPDTYALTASDIAAVKAGVTESLKDPTSAIFGTMKAAKSTDGLITVCGYVNGKNSYGGYVGKQPFVGGLIGAGAQKTFAVIGMGGTNIHTQATYQTCAQRSIQL